MEAIELSVHAVQWALETAHNSFERWKSQAGYYDNRLNSHFKGKLGELAVERFLLDRKLKIDSHFRFPDRENLADIVVKLKGYNKLSRIEVKTWSATYWEKLGRCIAVNQLPDLKKKADIIIWCVTDLQDIPGTLAPMKITLYGWSMLADVESAPIQPTGLENMRKVNNHQLPEDDLRKLETLFVNFRA
ncbi:MAG: hypothetical protein IT311_08475 [Anaerolineales bacterium]|nr:hypothetical protein [Anaerolineales bacterium]